MSKTYHSVVLCIAGFEQKKAEEMWTWKQPNYTGQLDDFQNM